MCVDAHLCMSTKQGIQKLSLMLKNNIAAKCKTFMNCSKHFTGRLQKEIRLPNKEYLKGHRCAETNMALRCKIFAAVTESHMAFSVLNLYRRVYTFKSYRHK